MVEANPVSSVRVPASAVQWTSLQAWPLPYRHIYCSMPFACCQVLPVSGQAYACMAHHNIAYMVARLTQSAGYATMVADVVRSPPRAHWGHRDGVRTVGRHQHYNDGETMTADPAATAARLSPTQTTAAQLAAAALAVLNPRPVLYGHALRPEPSKLDKAVTRYYMGMTERSAEGMIWPDAAATCRRFDIADTTLCKVHKRLELRGILYPVRDANGKHLHRHRSPVFQLSIAAAKLSISPAKLSICPPVPPSTAVCSIGFIDHHPANASGHDEESFVLTSPEPEPDMSAATAPEPSPVQADLPAMDVTSQIAAMQEQHERDMQAMQGQVDALRQLVTARGNVAAPSPAVECIEETPCDKIDPDTVKRDVADVLHRRGVQNAPDIARRAVEMQERYGWQIDGVPIRRPVRATVRFIMSDMGRFNKPTRHESAAASFFTAPPSTATHGERTATAEEIRAILATSSFYNAHGNSGGRPWDCSQQDTPGGLV